MKFYRLVERDLRLNARQGGVLIQTLGFYLLVATLFPLALGPETRLLARLAPGLLWLAALMAVLLSLDRIFQADFEDGSLDMLMLAGLPLPIVMLAKALAHWLVTGLPLLAMTPVLAIMMGLPHDRLDAIVATFFLGGISLSLIGLMGAALTLTLRRQGAVLALLLFPLYIPVLLMGVGALEANLTGRPALPYHMVLGGLALLGLVLAPLAAAAAVRIASE